MVATSHGFGRHSEQNKFVGRSHIKVGDIISVLESGYYLFYLLEDGRKNSDFKSMTTKDAINFGIAQNVPGGLISNIPGKEATVFFHKGNKTILAIQWKQ